MQQDLLLNLELIVKYGGLISVECNMRLKV